MSHAVTSRKARSYAVADCVTCGEDRPGGKDDPAGSRRWAQRHAALNPGHSVHVVTESTRVYKAADRADSGVRALRARLAEAEKR